MANTIECSNCVAWVSAVNIRIENGIIVGECRVCGNKLIIGVQGQKNDSQS